MQVHSLQVTIIRVLLMPAFFIVIFPSLLFMRGKVHSTVERPSEYTPFAANVLHLTSRESSKSLVELSSKGTAPKTTGSGERINAFILFADRYGQICPAPDSRS